MSGKKLTLLLGVTCGILLCLGLLLAIIATANRSIIGGADLTTFLYIFSQDKNGLYSTLSLIGALSITVAVLYSKKKH